jgi:hypothetical protein
MTQTVDDYFDPDCGGEPIFTEEDQGYGFCPECGSALFLGGAVSDGDGSIYDSLDCHFCHEERGRAHETWFDDFGHEFTDEDDWLANGEFLPTDDPYDAENIPYPTPSPAPQDEDDDLFFLSDEDEE